MADNFNQATVSPNLPASLFTEDELDSLEFACGLTCDRDGETLYFYADTSFGEEGEDDRDGEDASINCLTLLQEKLRQLDAVEYPSIVIQGAATCGKMRQDEFGGFAHFITREEIRSFSSWQWLDEQAHQIVSPPAPAGDQQQTYSVLLLYPDYLSEQYGEETYYAFVEAANSLDAVAAAQREAAVAQDVEIDDPADFAPLLVTRGHHHGEPMSEQ
jgi:hypothetical protein